MDITKSETGDSTSEGTPTAPSTAGAAGWWPFDEPPTPQAPKSVEPAAAASEPSSGSTKKPARHLRVVSAYDQSASVRPVDEKHNVPTPGTGVLRLLPGGNSTFKPKVFAVSTRGGNKARSLGPLLSKARILAFAIGQDKRFIGYWALVIGGTHVVSRGFIATPSCIEEAVRLNEPNYVVAHDGIDWEHESDVAPEEANFVSGMAVGTAQGFGATIVEPALTYQYSVPALEARGRLHAGYWVKTGLEFTAVGVAMVVYESLASGLDVTWGRGG